MRTGRAVTAAGLISLLAAIVVALAAAVQTPPSTAGGLVAPNSLGGARLASSLRGSAALAEISRLHGRRIESDDALIARYEHGLLLWVTADLHNRLSSWIGIGEIGKIGKIE